MKKPAGVNLCSTGVVACALVLFLVLVGRADPPLPGSPAKPGDAAASETQATTNVPAEVQLSPQAMEQIRREIESNAARNAEAITAGLSLIEPTLTRLQERQMEAVQSSNRTILMVAGIFAAVGFLGLLLITLILVRALGRFSELAVLAAPHGPMLGSGHAIAAISAGEKDRSGGSTAEQASARFQGAIDHLQKRILELEHTLQPSSAENAEAPQSSRPAAAPSKPNAEPLDGALNIQPLLAHSQPLPSPLAESGPPAPRVRLLLGKGQALLNLDAAEQALECFEELLALEPGHADALVKRGMALEKLQEWEQAVESYDRAIAADASLTVAYLYKGGVCNRLQRYREALESYEQALRTEKKSRAS